MTMIVIATVSPIPQYRAEVIAAIEAVIEQVHAEEDDCLLYALHEAPDRLVMIEKYALDARRTNHPAGDKPDCSCQRLQAWAARHCANDARSTEGRQVLASGVGDAPVIRRSSNGRAVCHLTHGHGLGTVNPGWGIPARKLRLSDV